MARGGNSDGWLRAIGGVRSVAQTSIGGVLGAMAPLVMIMLTILGLVSGISALASARSSPRLARRLALVPWGVAACILGSFCVEAVLYARAIPLNSEADHARLHGYLWISPVWAAVWLAPQVAVAVAARLRLMSLRR